MSNVVMVVFVNFLLFHKLNPKTLFLKRKKKKYTLKYKPAGYD